MRILVCGGRDFDDWCLLSSVLDQYQYEIDLLITGEAHGADFLARVWWKSLHNGDAWKDYYKGFPADWETYGKAAGAIRNKQMLDEGKPDLVIAFPGGKGTANMVKLAKEAGVTVREIKE